MVLDESLYEQITKLTEEGNALIENKNYQNAGEKYKEALDIIPEPKTEWQASTWIYATLGDTCFFDNKFEQALDYYMESLKCPDGEGNSYLHLRIGECLYELDHIEESKEYLLKAYNAEGEDIFKEDEADEKYIEIVKKL